MLNLTRCKNLKNICDRLHSQKEEWNIHSINFEPHRFPAAFIKRGDRDIRATVLLFNSGKFVFVGLKRLEDVNKVHDWLEIAIWHATKDQLQC